MMRTMTTTKRMVLNAFFIAVGMILPFLTGQIPQIGTMLLPMHIPVILCGLICGWKSGLVVGLILPVLRSIVFSIPVMFPMAIAMAFELGTYGAICGWLYGISRHKCLWALYKSMIAAMVGGRIVFGIVMMILMGINGGTYTFQAFISATLVSGVPGIILQLVLIPAIMLAIKENSWGPMEKSARDSRQNV